jgi:uncharacterized protein (DUF433 family)
MVAAVPLPSSLGNPACPLGPGGAVVDESHTDGREVLGPSRTRRGRTSDSSVGGRGGDPRAWIIGTSLDVWEVVSALRDFTSIEEMAAATDLSDAQIRAAVAYHESHADEIDALISRSRRSLSDLHADFPAIDVVRLSQP